MTMMSELLDKWAAKICRQPSNEMRAAAGDLRSMAGSQRNIDGSKRR